MQVWKHVFVHVDAGPHAPVALGKALSVAEAFDGRVTAFDSVSAAEVSTAVSLTRARNATDRVLDLAVEARTRELRDELGRLAPRVPVQVSVAKGLPGAALLRHAQNNDADLIFKAVSAVDVGEGTSAGAATQRLLREALVPVWLCSPHRRRKNRVLTAVNFATAELASENVLRAGARVASLHDAELHVLCVDHQASRRLSELDSRPPLRPLEHDDAELRRALGAHASPSGAPPPAAQLVALETIEKAVFDLEPDIVVLCRDSGALSGLPGTHLVERLFCRVECSMLLLPPRQGTRQSLRTPFEFWAPTARPEHYAYAAQV